MKRMLLLACVALAGCPPVVGETVTCSQTWTCGDDIVADNSEKVAAGELGHVFCTDPADAEERAADIAAYESEFADGCDGVNLGCVDPEINGEFAVCTAACVIAGACDIETAVRVRLD